jgi:hypothetical protein
MTAPAHLRVYRFGATATLEGGLVGALERLQLDPDATVLDVVFAGRDPATGALVALDLSTAGRDRTAAALLDFRLDPARRAALTRRTLAPHPEAVPRAVLERAGAVLAAGEAVLAVLHIGPADVLEEAVRRSGGALVEERLGHWRSLREAAPWLATGLEASGASVHERLVDDQRRADEPDDRGLDEGRDDPGA